MMNVMIRCMVLGFLKRIGDRIVRRRLDFISSIILISKQNRRRNVVSRNPMVCTPCPCGFLVLDFAWLVAREREALLSMDLVKRSCDCMKIQQPNKNHGSGCACVYVSIVLVIAVSETVEAEPAFAYLHQMP